MAVVQATLPICACLTFLCRNKSRESNIDICLLMTCVGGQTKITVELKKPEKKLNMKVSKEKCGILRTGTV